LNKDFIDVIYQHLNRVVSITDTDLKLDDVHGYISEIELNLENPWEDSVTVKNYKTKFEDLFSSIVASAEQMKTNSFAYNNAAGAFGPGGTLKPSVIQNTLNQTDLTYAFQSGNLTIDEINGIRVGDAASSIQTTINDNTVKFYSGNREFLSIRENVNTKETQAFCDSLNAKSIVSGVHERKIFTINGQRRTGFFYTDGGEN
jgi:hypothetical protein